MSRHLTCPNCGHTIIKPKSQQQLWQEKMIKQGLCRTCGKPVSKTNKQYCEYHRKLQSKKK